MSDFLRLDDKNRGVKYACSAFVHSLVCFFPKEGFAIFEGYCYLKPEDLPYEGIMAYRYDRGRPGGETGIFKLRITEVARKVVEPPSWKVAQRCGEQCGCDCECNIRFFPSDIIILKFEAEGLDERDTGQDWSYCIDKRFDGPAALLERYMALIDDPGYEGDGYMPREEDQAFYDEFHRILGGA